MDLSPQQLEKLAKLGIDTTGNHYPNPTKLHQKISIASKKTPKLPLSSPHIPNQTISSSQEVLLLKSNKDPKVPKTTIIPLISISGFTLLSLAGLFVYKTKDNPTTETIPPKFNAATQEVENQPTQVPKSIQHYLLSSQQSFSAALQLQLSTPSSPDIIENLNQSIIAATSAIKEFPTDYRGYQQRASIYQALADSQPQYLPQAINDLTMAQKLNSSSPEITRNLAALFAKQGDAQNTLNYLAQTVSLEPTKAQNFYDLAKIQQQTGLIPEALQTYQKLLTIVTDPVQLNQVKSETDALEKLLAQNPNQQIKELPTPTPNPNSPFDVDSPTLQASLSPSLVIASPEEKKVITVSGLSDSNSLSGTNILSKGQTQLTIENQNLTSTSQVYLTITKGGKNQNLQVLSKTDSSFTVSIDNPIQEDIEFKWWIINK